VTIPATVPQGSEIPEGLMNNPVCETDLKFHSQDSDPVRRIRNLAEEMFRTRSEFLIYSTLT